MNVNVKDFKFTKDHEWAKAEGEVVTSGISDYAQHELGDVVYVDLPSVGDTFQKGDAVGNIESVKAVSDIYAVVSGEVVETNSSLEEEPGTVNKDPYGAGWLLKIKMEDENELQELMDSDQYEKYLKGISQE